PGHQDLAALHNAFPAMVPAGTETGDGYQGTKCFPYPRWYDFLGAKGYESALEPWQAKWDCAGVYNATLSYAFYSYPSAADAQRAVQELTARGADYGSDTAGSRVDRKFVAESRLGSDSAIVVSTFDDPGRERWVLVV